MAKAPIRIAILECDVTIGRLAEGYGPIFQRLLTAAAVKIKNDDGRSPTLEISWFNVVQKPETYPKLEDIDAVLLSGSKFNSFDSDPWILNLVSFTKSILAQTRVRLIGVCFGHQIIGRALDIPVGRSEAGWELAVTELQLSEVGKSIFGGRETIAIHQMHRDIVHGPYPASIESLASTDRCATQGMYARNRLITVQGHPEFTKDIVAELLERRHEGKILDDETFNEAMSRVSRDHDGLAIAEAFIRFLLE
ncbi:class I glutamine amidotransferase-like protein [Dissoconium aciculare CBS 342.82]|uniref:Class I glutamine amidotransferase-like protein n=1 Tax=Dissoconium aciculare CBS 342.82 TaxID=1314786 RepID=A0A6J3M8K1_9PEZI|nr:class I glutamine amidotransferase-like protein [Dissoconium aciculare CBS 342.82]KAF1824386.1 class I glutamine amidotransferase-like protein [Dissoconium aciculare CBS 342.82]